MCTGNLCSFHNVRNTYLRVHVLVTSMNIFDHDGFLVLVSTQLDKFASFDFV